VEWTPLLLLIWVGGVGVALLRLLGSWLRLVALLRHTQPCTEGPIEELLADSTSAMGIRRQVRVLEGPSHISPLICGVLRPRLVLPSGWRVWPRSVLAAVLQHELAHVRRGDLVAQLVCDAAVALYWFNPLVWLAAREAHLASEQACDDEVLERGLAPAAYADALLLLVRMLRQGHRSPLPALGIAPRAELVQRVTALLDPSRPRRRLSGRLATGLAAGATVTAAALASMSPAEARGVAAGTTPVPPCCAALSAPVVAGALGRALDSAFSRLADSGFAGTVLIEYGGEVVLAKGFGLADRARRTPNTVTTRYHVAGITKLFTAVAIAELAQRGALDVGAPVSRYLPELQGRARIGGITIHQLLTHTDGLSDVYAPIAPPGPAAFLRALDSAAPAFVPGRSYGPGNSGHSLLALIIERITGRPFEQHLRERFLVPAGMNHSFLRTERGVPLDSVAVGYIDHASARPVAPGPDVWGLRGSRGLVSTAGDLQRWYRALSSGRLLSRGAMAMMLTAHVRTAKAFGQGYGWLLHDESSAEPFRSGPLSLVRRSGREPGFEAELVHDRSHDWVAIVLVNSDVLFRLRAIETIRAVANAQPPPPATSP
jgi:CubicO group peptidase (beta-lactamase class C family)